MEREESRMPNELTIWKDGAAIYWDIEDQKEQVWNGKRSAYAKFERV